MGEQACVVQQLRTAPQLGGHEVPGGEFGDAVPLGGDVMVGTVAENEEFMALRRRRTEWVGFGDMEFQLPAFVLGDDEIGELGGLHLAGNNAAEGGESTVFHPLHDPDFVTLAEMVGNIHARGWRNNGSRSA